MLRLLCPFARLLACSLLLRVPCAACMHAACYLLTYLLACMLLATCLLLYIVL